MSKAQARIIFAALFHDGIDVDRLSAKAKAELRAAIDTLLELAS